MYKIQSIPRSKTIDLYKSGLPPPPPVSSHIVRVQKPRTSDIHTGFRRLKAIRDVRNWMYRTFSSSDIIARWKGFVSVNPPLCTLVNRAELFRDFLCFLSESFETLPYITLWTFFSPICPTRSAIRPFLVLAAFPKLDESGRGGHWKRRIKLHTTDNFIIIYTEIRFVDIHVYILLLAIMTG